MICCGRELLYRKKDPSFRFVVTLGFILTASNLIFFQRARPQDDVREAGIKFCTPELHIAHRADSSQVEKKFTDR